MWWINLVWGVLNLFPIWPLDGGQMAGVILTMINRRNGMRWAHVVSLLTAGLLAMFFFQKQNLYLGLFFVYFAVINYQVLQSLHHAAKYGNLEDDADWWKR
jgi:Zn-dependent protease